MCSTQMFVTRSDFHRFQHCRRVAWLVALLYALPRFALVSIEGAQSGVAMVEGLVDVAVEVMVMAKCENCETSRI